MKPIALFAVAAVGLVLVAASSSHAHEYGPGDPPPASALGVGVPPELVAVVQIAVTSETDPAKLEQFAEAIAPFYPNAAAILRERASAIRRKG